MRVTQCLQFLWLYECTTEFTIRWWVHPQGSLVCFGKSERDSFHLNCVYMFCVFMFCVWCKFICLWMSEALVSLEARVPGRSKLPAWVLGIHLRSPARTVYTLNHWAFSLITFLLIQRDKSNRIKWGGQITHFHCRCYWKNFTFGMIISKHCKIRVNQQSPSWWVSNFNCTKL